MSSTRFGTLLTEAGFQKRRTNKGIVYDGIGLRAREEAA